MDGRRPATRSPATWSAGSAGQNVYADSATTATRRSTLADLDGAGADVVLLPDEPYVFTADDGPEAFPRTPTALVSGRLLTWYGPSLGRGPRPRCGYEIRNDLSLTAKK